MRIEKIIKLIGLNIGIAVTGTILFSPGLLGLKLEEASAFATTVGITTIIMGIIVFVIGNYKLLTEKEKLIQIGQIKSFEDCVEALEQNEGKKTFKEDIINILEQIERFQKKKETIKEILLQKFDSTEISYGKFVGTINDLENLFFMNIKSIINKINAFDEKDYILISNKNASQKFSEGFIQKKISIYNEYIAFVKNAKEDNEEIILKLDQLLLEITKFNSLEEGEIENMNAMKEIDELINKAKLYK